MRKKLAFLLAALIILGVFNVKSVVHADSTFVYAELKSGKTMSIDMSKCDGTAWLKFEVPSTGSVKIEYSDCNSISTYKPGAEVTSSKEIGYQKEMTYLSYAKQRHSIYVTPFATDGAVSGFVEKGVYYLKVGADYKTDYTTGEKVYPTVKIKCTFTPVPFTVDYLDNEGRYNGKAAEEKTQYPVNVGTKKTVTFMKVGWENYDTHFIVEIPADGKYCIETTAYNPDYGVYYNADGITARRDLGVFNKYMENVTWDEDKANLYSIYIDDQYKTPHYYELKKGTYFIDHHGTAHYHPYPYLYKIEFHEYNSYLRKIKNGGSSNYSNEWVKGKWYNKDGTQTYKPTLSWKSNKKGWWVVDSKGWYPKNQWQKIDGKWYYFKANGYMASNEWCKGYWLNKNGSWTYKKQASWKKDKVGWYFGCKGWYAKNQWQKIDGKWYYFDAKGYIVTGTKKIDGKTYRFNSSGACLNP